jgi:hypothetical protein
MTAMIMVETLRRIEPSIKTFSLLDKIHGGEKISSLNIKRRQSRSYNKK